MKMANSPFAYVFGFLLISITLWLLLTWAILLFSLISNALKYLFGFLLFCISLWLIIVFASRLLAWVLSRLLGASVGFRIGGWNCLRDVAVKFNKGAVESVSVGEIKLSLHQCLAKFDVGFFSRDLKLQLLICDLEIVLRASNRSAKKTKTRRSRSSGKGRKKKLMLISNIARYLSFCLTNLVVKMPKSTVEIKELSVDVSKDGGPKSNSVVRLHVLHIHVLNSEPPVGCEQLSNFSGGGCSSSGHGPNSAIEMSSFFICEKFSISCEMGPDREVGIIIKNVDISSGGVIVNLNEGFLLKSKKSSDPPSGSDIVMGSSADTTAAIKPSKKQKALESLSKYSSMLPEKVSFNLLKLDVKFVHREHGFSVENSVGIQLKIIKSHSTEDVGESTRLDFQLEFSEIHLLREAGLSILEILKVDLVSFVYIPVQPISPVRVEMDLKLGGMQCSIITSRLKRWLLLHLSKKKKMVLREAAPEVVKPQSTDDKAIMWTFTVSAPELTVVFFNLADSPVYHGCSQLLHLFANNIANTGTTLHMELGELNLRMSDEYQECFKESILGVDSNSGSMLHIAKVSLDWGKKDMEEGSSRCRLGSSVNMTGMELYLTLNRVESLLSTAISFQALLKSISVPKKKSTQSQGHSSKPSGKGIQMLKFNLERCLIYVCGDTGLENTIVPDPKRVNYGSQGGRFIVDVSADGTPRNAHIMSTVSDECLKLKYSVSIEIIHFNLCVNKEKQSTQVELERARSIYQEYMEENSPVTTVALFDMQNSKFVKRSSGLKDVSVCSLFSATHIMVRWEPDVHLSLVELVLQLKSLIHNRKLQEHSTERMNDVSNMKDAHMKKEVPVELGHLEKPKKKESIFAVDVESLSISAELGDGVDAMVQVRSIFSENARIGVLLEGLMVSFNRSRIFKTSRMQISRIPVSTSASDAGPVITTWDLVIQGLDIHICMPFRLELRAVDDVVEDMLRALKLIVTAKTNLIFPVKKESSKVKKSSSKVGRVRFCIRKITADIEEEPLQGWLDEHYHLMKKEAYELAVRLNFLDEFISKAKQAPKDSGTDNSSQGKKTYYNDVEVDVNDTSTIQTMREEIYKQSFRSYYQACQNLVLSDGSGACKEGFQAGFKLSTARTSVLSITALDLDVSLTKIDGGEYGMIEVVKKLDPVSCECNIPFSRLYGSNILLNTGSLVAQIRNYTFPLFSGSSGKCEGRLVLAQQATSFQPQIFQDVYVGKWRKVSLLRSASGTTPPMKTYADLPLHFQKGEASYGVGYEPVFADISYAFTVALRRSNLSVRNPGPLILPPKKEKSLPWWDDMRNYIHGRISLCFSECVVNVLGSTDPYEKLDKLQIVTNALEIHQSDGHVYVSAMDFKILLSSLESLANKRGFKLPTGVSGVFLEAPVFTVEVIMEWDCESGDPMNHYMFALPVEGKPREKVFDPFRSTALSLKWDISFKQLPQSSIKQSTLAAAGDNIQGDATIHDSSRESQNTLCASPTFNIANHDLAWLVKFCVLNVLPPHKLRLFSRFPRFGVPRIVRSGNLPLDKVITEFMLRIDATPTCIKHMPLDDDDPARGLTLTMAKLKAEVCFGRGATQRYTFESVRDLLDLVYLGVDLHVPKVFLNKEDGTSVSKVLNMTGKISQSAAMEKIAAEKGYMSGSTEKNCDEGFFLSSDYFTIRKQSPKADPARLVAWQEAGRKHVEMTNVQSECENEKETDEHTQSDPSDDDGYGVVIADSCQRVFIYGLKFLWSIENRNAVCSCVGGLSKAVAPSKPSPSRQYAQRKLLEERKMLEERKVLEESKQQDAVETQQDDVSRCPSSSNTENSSSSSSSHQAETSGPLSSDPNLVKEDDLSSAKSGDEVATNGDTVAQNGDTVAKNGDIVAKNGDADDSDEGTRHFMVNVIEPQFNFHSEDANGRFLLAAVSGRVLARSFHSVLNVGSEMIEQALGTTDACIAESRPEMMWTKMEFSIMLEHVQAHVAPTDVDLGAGLQWLPKIKRSSPKVMRTGALLERVFMPCDMYLRFTRYNGGTPELKVKPLKELTFNSHNITATMTSRQFQVMMDVLTNLLLARFPKPKKSSLSLPFEDDEDEEEELAVHMVPDGVEEVELAKINLEQKEREQKLLLDDIRNLSLWCDASGDSHQEKEGDLWMIAGGRSMLVQGLKRELPSAKESRKSASASLKITLDKAAQQRLMEKEKNRSPSCAMRVSLQMNKVAWSMLLDGKPFAEAEINDLIYDFDRDYKDVGIAQLTAKSFVIRNCLANAKSDTLLAPWNPPSEWGKKVMLRVDARQGAPKEGNSPFELLQVDVYPLKIHLTETMYRMMWGYLFAEEDKDSQRRQEVWKVSTTAGARRVKKGLSAQETSASKESETLSKSGTSQPSAHADPVQAPKSQNVGANPELKRTSSFDRSWEETVAESVANQLVLQSFTAKNNPLIPIEQQDETSKNKSKDSKVAKTGRSSNEEKKVPKSQEKKSSPGKMREFHNIKISQVELLVTYEGSRFVVNDLKLLMDSFHRVEFTGTWRRLFSRVKKHIIWGVLKSVTGMQGNKFKHKAQGQSAGPSIPEIELSLSDTEGQAGKSDQLPPSWPKRPTDGAGDGFVTSMRGLFTQQRRKAKAFVLRTMRGEGENDFPGDWSESDAEITPYARQLTIVKAKKLIKRHTKKYLSKGQGTSSQENESLPTSPRVDVIPPFDSDSSSDSSTDED